MHVSHGSHDNHVTFMRKINYAATALYSVAEVLKNLQCSKTDKILCIVKYIKTMLHRKGGKGPKDERLESQPRDHNL